MIVWVPHWVNLAMLVGTPWSYHPRKNRTVNKTVVDTPPDAEWERMATHAHYNALSNAPDVSAAMRILGATLLVSSICTM